MNQEPAILPPPPANDPVMAVATRFSVELRALAERFEGQPVRLELLLKETKGRGFQLLLLVIALPFVGPIPLPGFSIPFGLVVTILGMRMALSRPPWLPRALRAKEMPPRFFGPVMRGSIRLMEWLEIFLRPRFGFVVSHEIFSRMAGFLIGVSGLMLMLPFPLPFSNSLPAWTVIFLSAGALGEDGMFFVIGCGSFLLSLIFFTLVAVGGAAAMEQLSLLIYGE